MIGRESSGRRAGILGRDNEVAAPGGDIRGGWTGTISGRKETARVVISTTAVASTKSGVGVVASFSKLLAGGGAATGGAESTATVASMKGAVSEVASLGSTVSGGGVGVAAGGVTATRV